MTKDDVIADIAVGVPKYKGVFDIIGYNPDNDSFLLMHKDHKGDRELATEWSSNIIDLTRIVLSDNKFSCSGGTQMKNVEYKMEGTKLVITIDTSANLGKSKSGKNVIIASSAGNAKIEGTDFVLGLNLFTKE